MFMDHASLFIAAGICAAALSLTILSAWFANRADMFLVGWTGGMLLLSFGVLTYYLLPQDHMPLVALAFSLEMIGFILIYISGRLFTGNPTSWSTLAIMMVLVVPIAAPILAGYDGLGIATFNIVAGLLLATTAAHYWSARAEAPSMIGAMALIYGCASLSFFACGIVLFDEGRMVLHAAPDNWAERINAIACIAGTTGIGAFSLGLNNARAARLHRQEARTDALTGLLNRRALFDTIDDAPLQKDDAVIVFDLDHFKVINDTHGHAVGDQVLRRFAQAVQDTLAEGDTAARTGGEEFVLVLRQASPSLARLTADRIRAIFAARPVKCPTGRVSATSSAGIAMVVQSGENFDTVLHRADASLYRAKDDGRDRVVFHEWTEAKLQDVA